MKIGRKGKVVIAASLVAATVFSGYRVYVEQTNAVPYYQDANMSLRPERTAAVVFTGERERMAAALKLYLNGNVNHILITGYSENKNAARLIESLGLVIPNNKNLGGITFERNAKNTAENAEATASWLRGRRITDVVLVTSDYHMQRSLMNLETEAGSKVNIYQMPIKTDGTMLQRASESAKSFLTYVGLRGATTQLRF